MYHVPISRILDEEEGLPLFDFKNEWQKKNCSSKMTVDEKNLEFQTKYWDKLSKEEQNNWIEINKKAIDERVKKVAKALEDSFKEPVHTLREYQDIANKSYEKYAKLFREQKPGQTIDIEPPVNTTFVSTSEYKKRKALQQRAVSLVAKAYTESGRHNLEVKSLNFIKQSGRQMDRAVANICNYIDENGINHSEEYKAIIRKPMTKLPEVPELGKNPTKEEIERHNEIQAEYDKLLPVYENEKKERRELLDKLLSTKIEFVKELRKPMSDEEFIEKFSNPKAMADLQGISEIQKGNYHFFVDAFGVEPSPEVKKELLKVGEEAVADGTYVNRLGIIANPLYNEAADLDSANKLLNYFSDENQIIVDLANKYYGLNKNLLSNIDTVEKLDEYIEKRDKSEYQFYQDEHFTRIVDFSMSELRLYSTVSSAKTANVIGDAFGVDAKSIKYKDAGGKELDDYAAYLEMRNGKTVKLYSGDKKEDAKFLGSLAGGAFDPKFGCFNDPDIPANYKVDSADPEELKHNIKSLNKEIKNATSWYMRSSKEFTNFRKAMEEFEKSNCFDNPDEVKRRMKDIAKLANDYVQMKEGQGTDRSDITKKRLAIALKVADGFERTLSLASPIKELERENNLNEEGIRNEASESKRKSIVIEELANTNSKNNEEVKEVEPSLAPEKENELEAKTK